MVRLFVSVRFAAACLAILCCAPPLNPQHILKDSLAVVTTEPIHPGGVEVHIDIPKRFHLRNRGGSDGAGLCVFASLQHSAVWQDVRVLENIFEEMFAKPGGGWPERVEKEIAEIAGAAGQPVPEYVQIETGDLTILQAACESGRCPAVTYDYSPTGRYRGRISHMVTLVHLDAELACIVDNNFPGTYEWMSRGEFGRVHGGRRGWSVIFLAAGPPPPPRNMR